MSTPSQLRIPLAIPVATEGSSGNFRNVAAAYHITIEEFALIWACRRDDQFLFALDPHHCSPKEKLLLPSLRDQGFVWFSFSTGKWELKQAGRVVVETASLLAHSGPLVENRNVIEFKKPCRGNSA